MDWTGPKGFLFPPKILVRLSTFTVIFGRGTIVLGDIDVQKTVIWIGWSLSSRIPKNSDFDLEIDGKDCVKGKKSSEAPPVVLVHDKKSETLYEKVFFISTGTPHWIPESVVQV